VPGPRQRDERCRKVLPAGVSAVPDPGADVSSRPIATQTVQIGAI